MSASGPPRPLLSDAARTLLRRAVLDGTLLPGEHLVDAELIAWLGVSRTPIRAALDDLAEIGLVELSANRWTRVALPTADEVALDLDVWAGLAGVLAARARWTPGTARTLRRLLAAADVRVRALDGAPVGAGDLVPLGALACGAAGRSAQGTSRSFVDVSARLGIGLVGLGASVPRGSWAVARSRAEDALDAVDPSGFATAATALARDVLATTSGAGATASAAGGTRPPRAAPPAVGLDAAPLTG